MSDDTHLEALLLGIEPICVRADRLSKLPEIVFILSDMLPLEARPKNVEQLAAIWTRIQKRRAKEHTK